MFREGDLDLLYGDLKRITLNIKATVYGQRGTAISTNEAVEHILTHIESVGPAMRELAAQRPGVEWSTSAENPGDDIAAAIQREGGP